MAKYSKGAGKKVEESMHEMKEGKLKTGSGKKVTSRKQAIAIGLSEAREKGEKVPKKSSKTSGSKTKGATKKSSSKKSTQKTSSKSNKTKNSAGSGSSKSASSKRGLASASKSTKKQVATKGGKS